MVRGLMGMLIAGSLFLASCSNTPPKSAEPAPPPVAPPADHARHRDRAGDHFHGHLGRGGDHQPACAKPGGAALATELRRFPDGDVPRYYIYSRLG